MALLTFLRDRAASMVGSFRSSAAPDVSREYVSASPVMSGGMGGWWNLATIREPFTGAWQKGEVQTPQTVVQFAVVFACVTRIAQDISKMRIRLVQQTADGIWTETTSAAFSPVLTKPNPWQNRIQFFEQWMLSKLLYGNAYILKERDGRGVVSAMYVLDPRKVRPLMTEDGDVYYRLGTDHLAGVMDGSVVVPANQIIHDRINTLWHPLVGVSPIAACSVAAMNGLTIQAQSSRFFENNSRPTGILVAPGMLSKDQAEQLREAWEQNYGGGNVGKTAVLGNGLEYKAIAITAVDAELIKQLQMDERQVCTAFGVPGYMVGVGEMPKYDNIDALQQQYYSQCLQAHIEGIEICIDEGLGLPNVSGVTYGAEFDLDDLVRMDHQARAKAEAELVKAFIKSPNEARRRFDLPPTPGGDSPLAQQQNFSLEALAKRDAKPDPFAGPPVPAAPPADPVPAGPGKQVLAAAIAARLQQRGLAHAGIPQP